VSGFSRTNEARPIAGCSAMGRDCPLSQISLVEETRQARFADCG